MFRLLSLLILLFPQIQAQADSSVWQVSLGDSHIYLGGTIHLLRASDYPLPDEFEQAYQGADTLFFETDLGAMSEMGTQVRMLSELTYTDGRNLESVLSSETYTYLTAYLVSTGIPLMVVERFKPGLLISTLQVLELQKLGFTPLGVDAFFYQRALEDVKVIGELESIDEQIGFLASMGEKNEDAFIMASLQEMDALEESIETLVSAWREGDSASLVEHFIDSMKEAMPELYASLLLQRNQNWLPMIEAMFASDDIEFVLVGVAHLLGEDGLLAMLEARGYQIRPL